MPLALGALAGILSGLQGLPAGMKAGTEADQRQQQLDLQRQQMEEGRSTDLSSIAPILRAAGMNMPDVPGGRVPNTILPTLLTQQQKQAERAQVEGLRSSVPEQARPFLGVPGGPELYKTLYGQEAQKPQIVGENARGYLKGDTFTEFPQTPEGAIPPGMEPSSVTRRGVTYKMPGADKPEKTLEERVAMARERARLSPGDPTAQAELARAEDAYKLVIQKAQAGATTIKPPDSEIIQKTAQQNEVIGLGTDLANRWKANPGLKPGGMARLGEMELPGGFRASDVLGPQQTDEQRRFMADVTALIGTYRRLQSGLAVTKSESQLSLPLIPENPGAVTPQQINALVDWARRNKGEMDRALAAANKLPTPAPLAPVAPAPAAATPKGDSLSRRDPRYQKARERGMSDQQIQSKYGITLTD